MQGPRVFFKDIVGDGIFASAFVSSQVEEPFETFKIMTDSATNAPREWSTRYRKWLEERHLHPSFKCLLEEDADGSAHVKEIVVGGAH